MKEKLPMAARYILGLIFFVFGLNGFIGFLEMPPMPEPAMAMMGGLGASGYFFPLLKGTEVICGALLLAGMFVPLVLVILAPIVINIVLFHGFLAAGGTGMVMPIFILILTIVVAKDNMSSYSALLKKK